METVSGMKSVYLSERVMFRKKVKQQRQQHWSVFTLADAELHHHGTLTAACHIYAPRERGVCVWLCWYKCGYLQRVAQNHMSSMGGVEQGRWDVFVVSTLFSFAMWVTAVEHSVSGSAVCGEQLRLTLVCFILFMRIFHWWFLLPPLKKGFFLH